MKTIVSIFTVILVVVLVLLAIETASGQNVHATNSSNQTDGSASKVSNQAAGNQQVVPASATTGLAKIVGYRLPQWKTIDTSSDQETQSLWEMFTKIGCEVEKVDGSGSRIKFRCPEWRSMKVKNHRLQSQWAAWCEGQGLETVVVNPPTNTKRPTVQFRLPATRTVHLQDGVQAQQIINTLQLVGCVVKRQQHADHVDATFHCPDWTTLELPSESSAHSWQKWLQESGFETHHTHQE